MIITAAVYIFAVSSDIHVIIQHKRLFEHTSKQWEDSWKYGMQWGVLGEKQVEKTEK